MLQANFTTFKREKDSSAIDFDENSLLELSSEQSAHIAGGFTLKNNTEVPRLFYNFGEKLPLQQQTLKPGESGTCTYPGEFLLYNSSATTPGIKPAVFKADPLDSFSLNQSASKITPTDLNSSNISPDVNVNC